MIINCCSETESLFSDCLFSGSTNFKSPSVATAQHAKLAIFQFGYRSMFMAVNMQTPTLGIAAFSGTGKTTLLRQIIPILRAKNLRLGLIKHSHHAFEIDRPGKDSYILARAGALQTIVASGQRTAIITQHKADPESMLCNLVKRLDAKGLDLILVEGFKHQPHSQS